MEYLTIEVPSINGWIGSVYTREKRATKMVRISQQTAHIVRSSNSIMNMSGLITEATTDGGDMIPCRSSIMRSRISLQNI